VVAERDALKGQLEALGEKANKPEQSVSSKVTNLPKPVVGKFDEHTVLSQVSVEEYSYSTKYWNYAFLVFKNNSEFNLNLSADVDFFDAAGNLVGTKSDDQEAFEVGTETILYFMPDEKFTKIEYELSVEEEDRFECVISDLSYETTDAKDKIILSVTNNGNEPAEFVEGSVLFFNGGDVVGFSRNYFTDDDHEIKPGKTIKKEMNCNENFDSVKVYLSGRR
jgi:hypothetical protein